MDISSFSSGSSSSLSQASKLLDSLEKMGTSTGSDFKSSGPMGEPDAALVKEFEMALQGIDSESMGDVANVNESQNAYAQENQTLIDDDALYVSSKDDALHISNQDDTLKIDLLDNQHILSDTSSIHAQNIDNFSTTHENYIPQSSQPEANKTNTPEGVLDELKGIMEKMGQGNISASDLYRAQYITAMFSSHVTSGNKTSQQMAQGIESVLKQQ